MVDHKIALCKKYSVRFDGLVDIYWVILSWKNKGFLL